MGTTVDGMTIAKADIFECVIPYIYSICITVYMSISISLEIDMS